MAKKTVTTPLVELRAAIQEAETLTTKPELTKAEESRVNVLLAKIATLRAVRGVTEAGKRSEATQRWLRAFIRGENVNTPEYRNIAMAGRPETRGTDLLAGTQTPNYSAGSAGGFLVPIEYAEEVIYGLAQVDPLLDEDVVTLITDKNFRLTPMKIRGWDLSTISATNQGEGAQKNPIVVPQVAGAILNGFTYKLALDATFELEDDADADFLADQISTAYQIGFARGVGKDLVSGTGAGAPQGIAAFAPNSGVITQSKTQLFLNDFTNIYFTVDRQYRNAPKCAWLMNDTTYKQVLQTTDNQGRPLLQIIKDKETIFGKPVYVSPSMPIFQNSASLPGNKIIVFGDLSHFVVRASQLRIQRAIQAPGYVEKGKAIYTGALRVDATYFDPSNGVTPPVVFATQHS